MKIKNLALATAALLGLVGAPATFACSIAAWNGGPTGAPVAGRPNDASPTARYSGQCGLRAGATGQFVTDTTPAGETTFRARFYVYTGLTAGAAQVYRARNTGGTQMIGVTYDATAGNFTFNTSGGSGTVGSIAQNRWYAIELNWNRAAGNMGVTVRGAAAAADSTATVTGVAGTDQIDDVNLGWISGSGTAGSPRPITVDAYESRRSTAIGRLCRGDANNDNIIGVQDRIVITSESLGTTLAAGQPDANEDGIISVQDRIVVTTRSLNAEVCP